MTNEDQDHAEARRNRATDNRATDNSKSDRSERDATAKAVLDNMARLKALRLAREASEPARPVATSRTGSRKATAKPKKSTEKGPALAAWLAGQQSGGHRT
jgi:hypothetical protein